MKKQSKMMIGITAGVLLVAVIIIAAVIMASGSDSKRYARHMEAAQRYMDELDYEQAIAEYRAAIEIEPNNVEAYQALAELYVQTGDYESAIEVLNQGIEQTGSSKLSDYIEEVRTAYEEQKALAEATAQGEETTVNGAQEQEDTQENQQSEQLQEEMQNPQEQTAGNGARVETEYAEYGGYWVCEYDGNGNLVKGTYYNADGTLGSINEYDGNGNRVKGTWYNADGTLDSYLIEEYDGNGNCVKSTWYNADESVRSVTEY